MKKKRQFTVIIEEGEDGYLIGTALELKGCHTQGKTVEELLKNIREAIELYLEVEGVEGKEELVLKTNTLLSIC
jgi:predicted RNase H-like HicB family nuclease